VKRVDHDPRGRRIRRLVYTWWRRQRRPEVPRSLLVAVQIDDRLITSRKPADIPAFSAAIVKQFANKIDERRVDELSEQSFPASDPPPSPSAIGGEGAARSP